MARIEKRTLKDGRVRYKVIIRRKGLPLKTKTLGSYNAAKAWASRQEVDILDNQALSAWNADKHSVSEAINAYSLDWLPDIAESDQRNRSRQLDWWDQRIGHLKLSQVSRGLVSDERDDLIRDKKIAGSTANRYVAALSAVMKYCVEKEWISDNPVRGLNRKKESKRDRFLSDAEREALLEACQDSSDPRLFPLVLFAITTGARQRELMDLKWTDVNLEFGNATLHITKNRDKRTIHFPGRAGQVLEEMSRVPHISGYVFAHPELGRPVFPQAAWYRAIEEADRKLRNAAQEQVKQARDALRGLNRESGSSADLSEAQEQLQRVQRDLSTAGLKDFRFHDLRHTAASYLAMSGATLAEIAEILGHKTLAMVKRYSHLTEQHTSSVVDRMTTQFLQR